MIQRRFPLTAAIAATLLAISGGASAQTSGSSPFSGASTTPTGGELGVSPTTGVPDAPRRDTAGPTTPTMSDGARADAAPTPPSPSLPAVPPAPGSGTGDMSVGPSSPATSSRTADSAAAPGGVEILAEIDDPEVAAGGAGSESDRMARMQTMLLNRFGQLGFGEVREFRREGETYVTEALSKNGDWVTVVLDPASGTIAARR